MKIKVENVNFGNNIMQIIWACSEQDVVPTTYIRPSHRNSSDYV